MKICNECKYFYPESCAILGDYDYQCRKNNLVRHIKYGFENIIINIPNWCPLEESNVS